MANLHHRLVSSLWGSAVIPGQVVMSSASCHFYQVLSQRTRSLPHTIRHPHPQIVVVLGSCHHHQLSTLQIYCLMNHLFSCLLQEILGLLYCEGQIFLKSPSPEEVISFQYLPLFRNHGTICKESCLWNYLVVAND